MPRRASSTLTASALALFTLGLATPALATWPHDANNGNVALCTATGDQLNAVSVPDGAGGAIVAWQDIRSGVYRVYAQRVSAAGVPLWTTDGVPLCTAAGGELLPALAPDGAGGAIVTWQDARGSFYDIYAQRVSAAGALLWPATGVSLCAAANNQTNVKVVPDGAGGAIATWVDVRNGSTQDIFAQRVNAAGTPQWTTDGVPICQAASNQSAVQIASDGSGGAIITWQDARTAGNTDIYAQRVNAAGLVQWTTDGVPVCAATNNQTSPQIVADGAGGAIVVWQDLRNGTDNDIYAQRLSASSATLWVVNGVAVAALANSQAFPVVASDGAGGAFVAWSDARSGSYANVFAQRVSAGGTPMWIANGIALAPTTFGQVSLTVIPDGANGAIAAWSDQRTGNGDIYAQRVGPSGVIQWAPGGTPVSTAVGAQDLVTLCSDGGHGAIVAWSDVRSGSSYDIYAQKVEPFGYLGDPSPSIASVDDVPNDQGGHVKVAWYPSYLDGLSDPNLAAYDLYRSAPGSAAFAAARAGARLLSSFGQVPAPGERAFVVEPSSAQLYAWEYVGTIAPTHFLSAYGTIANTTGDSTGAGNPGTIFMVVARNATGSMYWLSAPDSGYSVDNLAPLVPAPFAGAYAAGATHLHWGANAETDLAGYRLYRGASATFVPGPSNLVVAQPDTGFADAGPAGSFYKLSAVDVHGNESGFALLSPSGTAGVAGDLPRELALSLASPNPGRGGATLRYALPAAAETRLAVYDVAGREVRLLASGPAGAGEHTVRWDGRDDAGQPAGGGVYLARLTVSGRHLVQRIALLR